LGRTARQDRKGQWSAILNTQDYAEEMVKSQQRLDVGTAVDTILGWGNAEAKHLIEETRGEHNRGLRMNELSEVAAEKHLLENPTSREIMAQLCNDYSRLSIEKN